jgi:hypothetical protein
VREAKDRRIHGRRKGRAGEAASGPGETGGVVVVRCVGTDLPTGVEPDGLALVAFGRADSRVVGTPSVRQQDRHDRSKAEREHQLVENLIEMRAFAAQTIMRRAVHRVAPVRSPFVCTQANKRPVFPKT